MWREVSKNAKKKVNRSRRKKAGQECRISKKKKKGPARLMMVAQPLLENSWLEMEE